MSDCLFIQVECESGDEMDECKSPWVKDFRLFIVYDINHPAVTLSAIKVHIVHIHIYLRYILQYYTYSCALAILTTYTFFKIHFVLKLIICVTALVGYGCTIFIYRHYVFKVSFRVIRCDAIMGPYTHLMRTVLDKLSAFWICK